MPHLSPPSPPSPVGAAFGRTAEARGRCRRVERSPFPNQTEPARALHASKVRQGKPAKSAKIVVSAGGVRSSLLQRVRARHRTAHHPEEGSLAGGVRAGDHQRLAGLDGDAELLAEALTTCRALQIRSRTSESAPRFVSSLCEESSTTSGAQVVTHRG